MTDNNTVRTIWSQMTGSDELPPKADDAGIPELMGRMKDAVDQLEAAVLARIEADAYDATDPKSPGYPEWVTDTADGGDE